MTNVSTVLEAPTIPYLMNWRTIGASNRWRAAGRRIAPQDDRPGGAAALRRP